MVVAERAPYVPPAALNNQWNATSMDDYAEAISYDPNGNILTYNRKGAPEVGKPVSMDELTYNYDLNKNRLNYINDNITSTYTEDIETQNNNNHTYDAIGNLKSDFTAGVTNITWSVYGKITNITKGTNSISYTYDAEGNRITKSADGITTIYVRDGSGKVQSVYVKPAGSGLQQSEVHLYGSNRIGIIDGASAVPPTRNLENGYGTATISTFIRNEKTFELSNHLGNVLATVGDKKIQNSTDNSSVEYFTADVRTASDYYPYGMLMPGRSYAPVNSYRYGFNSKEQDPEVKGAGNQYDYGFRIYDPRIGKFLSVDPLAKSFP
ncbi:hypothetical protein A4R26_17030 [Niastella populi]|uniref:Uncharacterized protein n=2 Tax=Niastella populi TaxID=550983 RepID=A0A1V9FZD6_9BACT|nr:hypothetical protein A4R26_17030 [Niastella populi]